MGGPRWPRLAPSCMGPSCTILHHLAPSCTILHHLAWAPSCTDAPRARARPASLTSLHLVGAPFLLGCSQVLERGRAIGGRRGHACGEVAEQTHVVASSFEGADERAVAEALPTRAEGAHAHADGGSREEAAGCTARMEGEE
eukprot:207548-Prymnesium_polylepis.1